MTTKDFKVIAEIIAKGQPSIVCWEDMVVLFDEELHLRYPQFDQVKFRAACDE